MNHKTSLYAELSYLILLFVEGKIQKEQFERLDTLLQTSSQARELYFEIMNVHLGLESLDVAIELNEKGFPCCFDSAALEALAEYEKVAPIVAVPTSENSEKLSVQKIEYHKPVRRISKSSIFLHYGCGRGDSFCCIVCPCCSGSNQYRGGDISRWCRC